MTRRVRDERDRIARELHDVLAHSVSAMVVQTAAAQDSRSRPDRAADLLDPVAETGRSALAESGAAAAPAPRRRRRAGPAARRPVWPTSRRWWRPSATAGWTSSADSPARAPPSRRRRRLGVPRGPGGADERAEARPTGPVTLGVGAAPDRLAGHPLQRRWGPGVNGGSGLGCRAWRSGSACSAGRLHQRPSRRAASRSRRTSRWPGRRNDAVVVADDQTLVRSGLELVLEARGCEVVGRAADGRAAVDVVRRTSRTWC